MVTNEDRKELREVLERARQGSPLATRTLQNIKQYAKDGDPTYVELEAALVKMIRIDAEEASAARSPKVFEWKDSKGITMGRLYTAVENGLPVLIIAPEDGHYSGTLSHESLFRLMTEIAENGLKRQRSG